MALAPGRVWPMDTGEVVQHRLQTSGNLITHGKRADAEKVLARLNELSKQEFVSPVWRAKIYWEKDKAFEPLERAYEDRSIVSVAYIKTNPMLRGNRFFKFGHRFLVHGFLDIRHAPP